MADGSAQCSLTEAQGLVMYIHGCSDRVGWRVGGLLVSRSAVILACAVAAALMAAAILGGAGVLPTDTAAVLATQLAS